MCVQADKGLQADLGIFTHISAYSDISKDIQPDIIRHIKAYSELCVTLVYSEPWQIQNQRHIQNPGILRTRGIFRTLDSFVKIANILYELNIMNFFNTGVTFIPIVFILCKKGMEAQGAGAMNFDIP